MKFRSLLLASAVLFLSCGKENLSRENGDAGIFEITATFADSDSKTVLGGASSNSVLWSPNDEISVFYNEDGLRFTSLNDAPSARATFTSSRGIIFGTLEGSGAAMLYGVYPYSETNAQEGECLFLDVPSDQTAVEGSFGRGAFPSVGRASSPAIAFYNVCGGLKFSVSEDGIKKVKFSGNGSEDIAGRVKVRFDESGIPIIEEVAQGEKTVTLSAPDGGAFEKGKWYFFSLLPTALDSGFSFEFRKREDFSEHASKSYSNKVGIKRSTFGVLRDIDAGVSYKVGIAALPMSESVVEKPVGSSFQLSYTVSPSDAEYDWIKWSSSNPEIASVDNTGRVTTISEGDCTISVTSDNGTVGKCIVYVPKKLPADAVNLGLSVYWSSLNIGADSPEEYGVYCAWGETGFKTYFSWSNYTLCKGSYNKLTKYILKSNYGTVDKLSTLEQSDDIATSTLGEPWRMPTMAEWNELRTECTWTWTQLGGVNGYEVVSNTTGKSIFLPAAGMMLDTKLLDEGEMGYYWSSELSPGFSLFGSGVRIDSENVFDFIGRCYGRSVRPVLEAE